MNLSRLVLEIFRVFEYHAQNLNTPQNSASLDLQMGFNSTFKGLIGKSFLLKVSSDTIPFLLSHIMPVVTMQVEKWSINLETVIGKII